MSNIIGSTYEIMQQVGAGGGGVVFLANHLRLNKQVVLKADKRKITTRPELLRREVDVLKDLSHPYIPQVYDFFVEGETVYTAMDFVDGESLDKALKRGEQFPQAQVIKWAKQLLEALAYLHSPTHGSPPRGYVHSDIKPANIMRRLNGDICLIDFNISLALGEENVIGASAGYASPEHYGLDFSFSSGTVTQDDQTALMGDETATLSMLQSQSVTKRRTILPDIRSDIYSTGATLYHLLSGKRPAKNAVEVVPLSGPEISAQVSAIIAKAMNPSPDLRYQTAEEMLQAFCGLHRNDPRARRHRKRMMATAALLTMLFLAGGLSCFAGLSGMRQEAIQAETKARQAEARESAAKAALSAIHNSENEYQAGNIPGAIQWAVQALNEETPYAPQAQLALTNALGVYDLSDGFHSDKTIELPSEPLRLILSPNGTRLGAITAFQADIIDLDSGETLAELPMEPSALSELVFLDENRLIYAGEGAVTAYDLASRTTIWTGESATGLALSGDGKRLATIYKNEDQARIYDTTSGTLLQTVPFYGRSQAVVANDIFADTDDDLLLLDREGNILVVSFSDGALVLFDLASGEELELLKVVPGSRFEGGFCEQYLTFSAWDGSESIFAAVDTAQMEQTIGFSSQTPFHVRADRSGVYLSADNLMVRIDPASGNQSELAYPDQDITLFQSQNGWTVTASEENKCTIFDSNAKKQLELKLDSACDFLQISGSYTVIGSRNSPIVRLLKLADHSGETVFSYDPYYIHQEARLSSDGSTVMLFSSTEFCLYSIDGSLLAEVAFPDAAQLYDPQFRREADGTSYLELLYNDGTVRCYSAKDGSLMEERKDQAPDGTFTEEFFTDHLRIISPLHGTPEAYNRETGELIATLEEGTYLTYVTQVDEYIITEYVSAQGERYGLLLDEECNTLAKLPELCDIVGNTLVFDYPSGNLRQCRIYSLQELMSLAE